MSDIEQQFVQEVVMRYADKQMEAQLPSKLHPLESNIPILDEEINRWRSEHGQQISAI